ncbi:MAG: ketol-acid reductoisomerase [Planctomycetota bacterium]|jgi:ketol-acid reductoisomerase
MAAKVYYSKDAKPALLKKKTIAIIGYGSQGHAQAQNLRDSGFKVIVAEVKGTQNWKTAVKHRFKPVSAAEAARKADFIQILIPDTVQAKVYERDIEPNLCRGKALGFSHGFNIRFGGIRPPKDVDVVMVAPKGPGHLVRSEYQKGGGVPCLLAVEQNASRKARELALAYAWGIGGTRAGVIKTTFAEETETDLFGEQVILCGGVSELVKSSFNTLVAAGYQPEIAYFECLHELKLIVDLFYRGGISFMRYSVSDTAEYGDYQIGPRIITGKTRAEMKKVLREIKSGKFARKWMREANQGKMKKLLAKRRAERDITVERVGRKLRKMMPWLDPVEPPK